MLVLGDVDGKCPNGDVRQQRGEIQVIFGPMFSGKTTELMRRLKRYQFAKHRVLIIKYQNDTRYDKEANIATHDRQTMAAVSCLELNSLVPQTSDYSVIGIDEGQFFPDCVPFAENMANAGKIVIVAALDGSYERKGFGNILELVPLAESVRKLNAVCMRCYSKASFTKRIGFEKELEVIGGADKYMAVCRECHKVDESIKSTKSSSTFVDILNANAAAENIENVQCAAN